MFNKIGQKIFGSHNERELKRYYQVINRVNELEPQISKLTDDQLKAKTPELKQKLANGASLDDILFEAFAVVREASKRTVQMRHFDVQLIGGLILHEGKIAEMKTGEGKTVVATLPMYLNGLTGKGCHLVTVNDYLANRDAQWMGKIFNFLGLSVGTIIHGLSDQERKAAYGSDITYGTNNEFGFDYLRDNMKFEIQEYVQKTPHYAIVDEVDSILIDEARTPLIISGPTDDSTDKYFKLDTIIPRLQKDTDFTLDEKSKNAALTEDGMAKVEKILGVENLYDPANMETLHHINQALKAHKCFRRDIDYVVNDNQVQIVDEFTGRLMPGRRWSDGLHQAVEAKEKVKIERENQTLATITFQNYFRMYEKLAGMTGTADTEAAEFKKIYDLDVVVVPTNKPMTRADKPDVIYKTEKEKFNAAVREIQELNAIGRPVLVGTISIEKSEHLSKLLKKHGVKHHILNAKQHDKEAEIVSQAGQRYAVTISTNMAGRGTDIVLGEGVADLGGLHILGTERHESRRIDNQLRGRSGRQGDMGSSKYYLSLEDDLLRIFGSEKISLFMDRLGIEEGTPIEHNFISKAIANAQKRVEGHNFDIRKHLLKYDDVMNQQRKVIYKKRKEILLGESLRSNTMEWIEDVTDEVVFTATGDKIDKNTFDYKALCEAVFAQFNIHLPDQAPDLTILKTEDLYEFVIKEVVRAYEEKEGKVGLDAMRHLERVLTLQNMDNSWKEHLLGMDHLKEGVSLRGYAQKDPLLEYKKEGFNMFDDMFWHIKVNVIEQLFKIQLRQEEDARKIDFPKKNQRNMQFGRSSGPKQPVQRKVEKVGRNDPCSCGSGKKYKKCCGK
ncbi:MAG: preprotein translocase subunit SecA [Pseudomonadota bacterium]